jgi:hypothetical protein
MECQSGSPTLLNYTFNQSPAATSSISTSQTSKLMSKTLTRLILLLAFSGCFLTARAGEIVDGDPADGDTTSSAINNGMYDHMYTLLAGSVYNGDYQSMVEAFALPYLAPGQTVTSASVSFYRETQTPPTSPTYNLQLYALKRVSTTSAAPLVSDWYVGSKDTSNTLLDGTFITPATPAGSTSSYGGTALTSFINSQYANSAFSGMSLSNTRWVFFRLNADSSSQSGFNNYLLGSARNPNRVHHPMLSLTISGGISNVAGLLQFSFNLPQNAVTSAGVYNTTTGVLMRTLWNNVQYGQGTNYGVWDGKDDSGNAVPSGSDYQIKLIYHNVQYVWEGIIGNTSTNQTGGNVYRAFGKIHDMAFSGANGYYAVGYNELECPFHTFTVGTPQVPSDFNFGYTFTDAASCMYFVAADSTRTYWAKTFGGMNGVDTFVIAINNNVSPCTLYTFPKGTVPPGGKYPSCVDFDATANQANPASGIAVQQSGNDLFVSHGTLNQVRVFDKVQGNLLGSFTVTNPGRLATTADGDVWVISNGASPTVLRYTFANGTATLKQTLTGFSAPAGVSVSADDSLVLVADGGASQQIKAYNNSTGASAWTYGTLGGMPKNGPDITTSAFDFNVQQANFNIFSNEAFISFQPDNTFWVEDGGNGRILHYSISGSTLTYIEQIAYTDASYRSTVDLTDATRVFNTFIEYSVNYAIAPGGTNGSWKMVKNWSMGLPNDSTHLYFGGSNGLINVVTLSNGRTYGFISNMANNNCDLFELPATGAARYTGYSFNNNTFPLIYADGTLRYNVVNGSATALSFYSEPLTGFDSSNNPVWGSPATVASTSLNSATDPIPWAAFPMRTEITASGIVVDFDGNQANSGYHLAGIPQGSTTWKWHSSPSVNGPTWFPQDGRFDIGNGVQYAGNYAMALGRNIVYGYHGEFWCGGEASQWVNFLDNGLMVGRFGTYGTASSVTESTDGFAGNSFSPTLVQAANGNTYLYHNDEANHGGTIRWRIDGWNAIAELDGTGAVGSTLNLSANTGGPTVTLASPTANAAYDNGQSVTLSAQAASTNASISSVQFLDGSTSLGSASAAPFILNAALTAGTHTLTAVATDSNGLSTTSAAVAITVGAGGASSPAPAPISLTSTSVTTDSVALSWNEPTSETTSSTIGSIIGLQFDSGTDSAAMAAGTSAGAAPYTAANFNHVGQFGTGTLTFVNVVDSAGGAVSNLGLTMSMGPSNSTNSTLSLPGSAQQLFGSEVGTNAGTMGISISNIPYASYDIVVYSLPPNLNSSSKTASVTVSNYLGTSVVQQSFTKAPTAYTFSDVAFGTNASVTDINTVVVQGLVSPIVNVQGPNIAAIQIVQRPYNQGTPTSYTIQRAPVSTGAFVTIGTVSGTSLSYTDTSTLSASTTYEYRVQAVNSFGASAASNSVSITTPASASTPTTPVTTTGGFAAWQSKYFTAAQLADPTISGPTADPYGSGVPNLLAYALQLNPSTAQLTNVPSPTIVNGHLAVTYVAPSAITDITFIVEVSPDLVNWNSGSGYTEVVSSVASAAGQTITVQDDLPPTTQKSFMRLRVTQN